MTTAMQPTSPAPRSPLRQCGKAVCSLRRRQRPHVPDKTAQSYPLHRKTTQGAPLFPELPESEARMRSISAERARFFVIANYANFATAFASQVAVCAQHVTSRRLLISVRREHFVTGDG